MNDDLIEKFKTKENSTINSIAITNPFSPYYRALSMYELVWTSNPSTMYVVQLFEFS